MNTAENGFQQIFTSKASKLVKKISRIIYENRSEKQVKIQFDDFLIIVKQVITDFHAENRFAELLDNNDKSVLKCLKSSIEECIKMKALEFTFYFPAWTVGVEHGLELVIGPVTFLSRENVVEKLDYSDQFKQSYSYQDEDLSNWKELLKIALKEQKQPEGLTRELFLALKDTPSALKITISGHDKNYSRKLGELICRTALDSTSLAFNGEKWFLKQALHGQRLPSWSQCRLIEVDNYIWSIELSRGERNLFFNPSERYEEAFGVLEKLLSAIANILEGLIDPQVHRTPKLVSRWATALDWFAEGARELDDSIAIAKYGTCLDVLSGGGKYKGILDMVGHLLELSQDSIVIMEPKEICLKTLIRNIYEEGRSQILHGNHIDRLQAFELERARSANVARLVLLECLLRLEKYEGQDGDKSFVTMPKST